MAEGGQGDHLDVGEPLAASSRASTVNETATNTFLAMMEGENRTVDASIKAFIEVLAKGADRSATENAALQEQAAAMQQKQLEMMGQVERLSQMVMTQSQAQTGSGSIVVTSHQEVNAPKLDMKGK